MAAKKASKNQVSKSPQPRGTPRYPYLYSPASMNRFLKEVPKRPRPDVVDHALLKTWGFNNTNDQKIASVLKTLTFLDDAAHPTEKYEAYMQPGRGPVVLGKEIQRVYDALFKAVKNPNTASNEELRSFFLTYGGGGEKTVLLMIQTFKNMAQNAIFGGEDPFSAEEEDAGGSGNGTDVRQNSKRNNTAVHIDLHIHLPEEKTKADYDSILESIAKHIYGKTS